MIGFLREFFALNRDIIFFVYGLSFFVLGLAVALQTRHASRLELARSLNWLAAFGITHGLHEWGEYFIPIQSAYLSPAVVHGLEMLRLMLLALSFACLFQFGVRLLQSIGLASRLSVVPAGLLATWVFVAFFPLPALIHDSQTWQNIADSLARYFIGFPGGLLSAYALRRHAHERIRPLNVPDIVRNLRVAGLALFFYALFAGLLPPATPYFPGNLLNAASFEAVLIFPVQLIRSLIGITLAVSTIRGLEVFDVETARTIEAMEQQQILAAERNRLARDLHDGAIQKVYTAGLIVESARNLVPDTDPAAGRLDRSVGVLNDAIRDLRNNIEALQSTPSDEPLAERLRRLAEAPGLQSFVSVDIDIRLPSSVRPNPIATDHILAIVSEALANIVRHAHAQHVTLRALEGGSTLEIEIDDDGRGFDEKSPRGFGLRNMRDRARLVEGELTIEGNPGKGTHVHLSVPWEATV